MKKIKIDIPYHPQKMDYLCGPASLQMVFGYFKDNVSQTKIAKEALTDVEQGTDNAEMIRVATERGFYVYVNDHSTFYEIRHFLERGLPVIVNYIEPSHDDGHFAVVSGMTSRKMILHDPWNGKDFKMSYKEFTKRWYGEKNKHREWIMVVSSEDFKLGKQFMPKAEKSS